MRSSRVAQQPSTLNSPSPTSKCRRAKYCCPSSSRQERALVTNLTAKDFTLTEDGRPQVIKSFTSQSNLPFRLGLLVDTSRSVYSAMDTERKAAGKFIDLMLPADPKSGVQGDEAFLIHFDREVELLEDFTNSRDKLHHELDGMGPSSQEHNNQGPETSGGESSGNGGYGQHRRARRRNPALRRHLPRLRRAHEAKRRGARRSSSSRTARTAAARRRLNDAIDAADRANVQVFTIYFKGEEEHSSNGFPGNGGHHGGMGGGGGYPGGGGGYPGGGGHHGGNPKSEAGVDGKKIMQQIASRTGGQFFEAKKKDNLDEIYNQIATLLRQQYLLDLHTRQGRYRRRVPQDRPQDRQGRPDRIHSRRLLRPHPGQITPEFRNRHEQHKKAHGFPWAFSFKIQPSAYRCP